jgi:hypothetical protein
MVTKRGKEPWSLFLKGTLRLSSQRFLKTPVLILKGVDARSLGARRSIANASRVGCSALINASVMGALIVMNTQNFQKVVVMFLWEYQGIPKIKLWERIFIIIIIINMLQT